MRSLRAAWDLLRSSRDFSLLMAAQFCAQMGDGVVQGALAKYIVFGGQRGFDLQGARSPDELLRIALYVLVPYTILSPFLGVLIDRWDRRRLLFLANGVRALVLTVVVVAGVGRVGDAAVFGAFVLTLSSTRLVIATKGAALPATLGGERLLQANSVSQMGGVAFQLFGVGIALAGTSVVAASPVVVVGVVVYAAGAVAGISIRRPGEPRRRRTLAEQVLRVVEGIVQGLREVARTPKAAASITTYLWLRMLWSVTVVSIGFVARDLLAADEMEVAVVVGGAGAAGAAIGFAAAERVAQRAVSTARVVLASSAAAGLAVALLGPFATGMSLAAMTFFLGLGFFLGKISLDTMVQESLGDGFRGRAFALYDIAYNVAWLIGAVTLQVFWSQRAAAAVVASAGAVFLVGLAALALWYRKAGLTAPRVVVGAGDVP